MPSERRLDLGHQSGKIRDRFSNLPDDIAHRILFFLEMEDLGRFSLVSKRCGQFCLSVPGYKIDYRKHTHNSDHRHNFISYVDRFITSRHKNGIVTRKFDIRWSFEENNLCDGEESLVDSWWHQVLTPELEYFNLIIVTSVSKTFNLLPILSQCTSLVSLFFSARNCTVKLPTFSLWLPKLECLKLLSVRIEHPFFGQWVSTFCRSLRVLILLDVSGQENISIISPSLQSFVFYELKPNDIQQVNIIAENLRKLDLQWVPNCSTCTTLMVSAPNLSTFILTGHSVNYYYCVGKLMHLQTFVLDLSECVASTGHNLDDLIQSVGSTKTLRLSFHSVKVLYDRGCLPSSSLNDIEKCLVDTYSLEDDQVPAVASLLSGMPNLKALHVTRYSSNGVLFNYKANLEFSTSKPLASKNSGFSMEYWESKSLMFVHHLKSAVVELQNGDNDLELVKYLLKHAEELEKMKIICSTPLPYNVMCEIYKYKKASTEVVLSHK